MGLKEIERNIYVSEDIALHEYQYVYGEKKDNKVWFTYYNFKKDEEGKTIEYKNYSAALTLARKRAGDGRYKNYEYWIEI